MRIRLNILTLSILMALTLATNVVAATDADTELLSLNCDGCHGPDGVSSGRSIPSIAGLDFRYFMRTMLKFRKGERASTIMDRIAQGYKISELRKISGFFAAREWGDSGAEIDGDKARKGQKIHDELCEECHEKNGRYQDKDIARISGQAPDYLYLQLLDYHAGMQAMPQPDKMKERLETLKVEDLEALSHFYGSGS